MTDLLGSIGFLTPEQRADTPRNNPEKWKKRGAEFAVWLEETEKKHQREDKAMKAKARKIDFSDNKSPHLRAVRDDEPLEKGRRSRVRWASEIEPAPVVWAWQTENDGRLPAGALSLGAGREGTGKSSFGIWLSAQITRGRLPGSFHGKPRRVLYLAVEDSWKHTLVPRLIAAKADLSMVGQFDVLEQDEDEMILSLPHDNALFEQAIVEDDIALVVIDPITSVIGEGIDTHNTRQMRQALDPLAKIADRTGCVIFGIAHFNKSSNTDAASLLSGSHALRDVPRALFGFAKDGDTRVMSQVKNSLGRDDLQSFTYKMEAAEVKTRTGIATTAQFTFTGSSDRSVEDVLRDKQVGPSSGQEASKTAFREALDWVQDYMETQGDDTPADAARKAATAHGISNTTLIRAREKLGVASVKRGAAWVWTTQESK